MAFVWAVTLVIFGCVRGFDFDPLFWWLCLPLFLEDLEQRGKS